MFTLLITLILITSALLILIVLGQNSKKEGLGSPLGDAGASQLIGVQKTSDLLEQLTWILIFTLFASSLATSFSLDIRDSPGDFTTSPIIERAQERRLLPEVTPNEVAPEELQDPKK